MGGGWKANLFVCFFCCFFVVFFLGLKKKKQHPVLIHHFIELYNMH